MGERPTVFISHSPRDKAWRDRLAQQLRVLEGQGILDVWDDSRIAPGGALVRAREEAIGRADVAILLVTKDYLGDRLLLERETARLRERQQTGALKLLPVIIRACPWQAVSWLASMQLCPRDWA